MIVIMPYLIQRVATILNANLNRTAIYNFFAEKQSHSQNQTKSLECLQILGALRLFFFELCASNQLCWEIIPK